MAVPKSTRCYRENPEAAEKHRAYNKKQNAKPVVKKHRAECAKKRRDADANGVDRSGKDYDRASNRFISSSANRGKSVSTNGSRDSNARKKGISHPGRRGK